MKTYIQIAFLITLLESIGGCSLMKTRNRLTTSATSEAHTDVHESTIHQQSIVMQRAVLDSSEAAYTIVIYPIDSFQFSLIDGFKGRATKVEVTGSIRQKTLAQDSTSVTNVAATERVVESAVKTKSIFSKDDKMVERTPFNWRMVLILALCLVGFVGWVYWRSRINRRCLN